MLIQNKIPLRQYEYRKEIIKFLALPLVKTIEKSNNVWLYDEEKNDIIMKQQSYKTDSCKLGQMNKTRPCMVCYFKKNTFQKMTQYECVSCNVPVCALNCYDTHRNNKTLDDYLLE